MTHGPEHHIEHAEHAAHASHDHFDKRVTISIAIVAAVLACVTMLGHRAHNDTLRYQTEGGNEDTLASNEWARYQAVNVRSHFYQAMLAQSEFLPKQSGSESSLSSARAQWKKQIDKYEAKQLPELEKKALEHKAKSTEAFAKSIDAHARSDRFDLGELALQLGVVLCSLAILTKGRAFWFLGIASAVIGAVVGLTGYLGLFLGHH